jgi:hypothetical protein
MGGVDWVPNSEKTRWFMVLRIIRPSADGLNKLLGLCNETVQAFSQPPLYASPRAPDPPLQRQGKPRKLQRQDSSSSLQQKELEDFTSSFHVSIGWALEQPAVEAVDLMKTILDHQILGSIKKITIKVDNVKVKIGNVVTSVALPLKAVEGKALFGP